MVIFIISTLVSDCVVPMLLHVQVARAKDQCKKDGIDFDEDTYRAEMAEKLR